MTQNEALEIETAIAPYLDNAQLQELRNILRGKILFMQEDRTNDDALEAFISAKMIEGCSKKTLAYYKGTIKKFFELTALHYSKVTTGVLRQFLIDYQKINNCSMRSIDNLRRILSSFFNWLECEDYIIKSPMKRVHKVKFDKRIKEPFTDEELERLRDACDCERDLAIIDFLASSGVRIGELVGLNRSQLDFEKRECVVFGKGRKERVAYFDARAKLHLQEYLATRTDDNPALFVSLKSPHMRLNINGIGRRLFSLGRKVGVHAHPHKFRRTVATRAMRRRPPITTSPTQSVTTNPATTTAVEYVVPKTCTPVAMSAGLKPGSKNR